MILGIAQFKVINVSITTKVYSKYSSSMIVIKENHSPSQDVFSRSSPINQSQLTDLTDIW